jgi:hypothetical protein
MDRVPVSSSNLASVGYEPTSQTLEVEFQNGSIYQYFGVPADVYQELLGASSKGSYFGRAIRNVYPYSRVS